MKACMLTPLDLEIFTDLFPVEMLDELTEDEILIGCVEEDPNAPAVMGILMAHVNGAVVDLDWVYVDKAYRLRGAGSQMLLALIRAGAQTEELRGIVASYVAEDEGIEPFLRAHGFYAASMDGYKNFVVRLGDFRLQPAISVQKNYQLVSLQELPETTVERINQILSSGNIHNVAVELPIDPEDYRPESMVCMENGNFRGLWLVEGDEDGLTIPWMCMLPGHSGAAPLMMNASLKALAKTNRFSKATPVAFASLTPNIEEIINKLFPNALEQDLMIAELSFDQE